MAYNKQAQLEMEARTTDIRPHVRTLNSLGLWILARHRGTSPPMIDERDVRRLVERFMPGRRPRRSNTDPIGPYVEALATIRLGLRDPDTVEAERDDVPGLGEVFPLFQQHLAERGVVDFDEQIYGAIRALLSDGEFRREMQRSTRHLLVDEFQDLTPAHLLLLRLLALPALDVFGVGDDDQCIYGHAGADPGFLIDFARRFPGAAEHPLTVNYRCPAPVVDAARTLLGYNHRRVGKEIHAGPSAVTDPSSWRVIEHPSDAAATTLVDTVRGWIADGAAPTDIAVLARVNSLLLAPHVALHEAGIALSSVLGPEVLERTGLRAALGLPPTRRPTRRHVGRRHRGGAAPSDPRSSPVVPRSPRPTLALVARPAPRHRGVRARQGRPEGRPPRRRSGPGGCRRPAGLRPRGAWRPCATASGWARP